MHHFNRAHKSFWLCLTLLILSSPLAARERSNPFAQPNYAPASSSRTSNATALPELKLKAVMPGDSALANIDGQMLRVGDVYEGYELISVTRHGASLRRADQILNLELRPEIAQAQRNAQ